MLFWKSTNSFAFEIVCGKENRNFVKYFPIYSIKTAFHLSCPQIPTYLWYNVWLYCRAIYIREKPIFVDFVNHHEFICQQIATFKLFIYVCYLSGL